MLVAVGVLLCAAAADVVRIAPHGVATSISAPDPAPAGATVRIAHPRDNGFVTVGDVVYVDIAHSGWSFESDGDLCIDVGDGVVEVRVQAAMHASRRAVRRCIAYRRAAAHPPHRTIATSPTRWRFASRRPAATQSTRSCADGRRAVRAGEGRDAGRAA